MLAQVLTCIGNCGASMAVSNVLTFCYGFSSAGNVGIHMLECTELAWHLDQVAVWHRVHQELLAPQLPRCQQEAA
jgi:hypothetical protein